MIQPTTNCRGQKPFKPAQRQREVVMTLAAAHLTLPEIAVAIDISRATLCRHFAVELARGRAVRLAETLELLRKHAKRGSVAAARSLLSAYGRPPGQVIGKKAQRELNARTAVIGTEWEHDLIDVSGPGTAATDWADVLGGSELRDEFQNSKNRRCND